MTIKITVKVEEEGSLSPARVHRVEFGPRGVHAEDATILQPGESKEFTIYGTIHDPVAVRLAIEEWYPNPDIKVTGAE